MKKWKEGLNNSDSVKKRYKDGRKGHIKSGRKKIEYSNIIHYIFYI